MSKVFLRFLFCLLLISCEDDYSNEANLVFKINSKKIYKSTQNKNLIYEHKTVSYKNNNHISFLKNIYLIWFNTDNYYLSVIDNGGKSNSNYLNISKVSEKNKNFGIVNGGFFTTEFKPLGLMISESKSIGSFGAGKLLSGVLFSDENKNTNILRKNYYLNKKNNFGKIDNLVQSGPFLIYNGVPTIGLSSKKSRKRTFVISSTRNWFALAVSDAFTLLELSRIIKDENFLSESLPIKEIVKVLNLDGGTSTGIHFSDDYKRDQILINPSKSVRNFIAIKAK